MHKHMQSRAKGDWHESLMMNKPLRNRMLRPVAVVTTAEARRWTQGDQWGCWSPWQPWNHPDTHTHTHSHWSCKWALLHFLSLWILFHHPKIFEQNVFTHKHNSWTHYLFYEAFSSRAPAVEVTSDVSNVVFVCTYAAGRSVSVGRLAPGLNTPYEPSGKYSTCWPNSSGLQCHSTQKVKEKFIRNSCILFFLSLST